MNSGEYQLDDFNAIETREAIELSVSASSSTIFNIKEATLIKEKMVMRDEQEAVNVHAMEFITDAIAGDEKVRESIILSIWDLGGQEVFYTLHHLFLT